MSLFVFFSYSTCKGFQRALSRADLEERRASQGEQGVGFEIIYMPATSSRLHEWTRAMMISIHAPSMAATCVQTTK
jgi:hypothetical protein